MNCENCGRVVYPNQTKCYCGTKIHRPYQPPAWNPHQSVAEMSREFGDKLTEVNAYVKRYRQSHQDATKRDACLAYLREHGLMGALPDPLRRQAEAEARAEREAIQAESTP